MSKKKRSTPVSLHIFHYFRPKYAQRMSKQMLTFFFFWRCYCSDKFFGKNVRTLTQIARKIKSCPKFLQPGGASAPPDPPLRTPMTTPLTPTYCFIFELLLLKALTKTKALTVKTKPISVIVFLLPDYFFRMGA